MGVYDVTNLAEYKKAMDLAKTVEATVEGYVGLTVPANEVTGDLVNGASSFVDLMKLCHECIIKDNVNGNPRNAYFTIYGEVNPFKITELAGTNAMQEDRICICQYPDFGKIINRICNTPYNTEPGYLKMRSIQPGIYNKLTKPQKDDLEKKGLIFLHDEKVNSEIITRINLAIATSFSKTKNRPASSFMHVRRNVDHLVRLIYNKLYEQVKRNETEINISFLQTDVDAIINDEIIAGNMKEGTEAKIKFVESEPMTLACEGKAKSITSTQYIKFDMAITNSKTGTGGDTFIIAPSYLEYVLADEGQVSIKCVDSNYNGLEYASVKVNINGKPSSEVLKTDKNGAAVFSLKDKGLIEGMNIIQLDA